MQLQALWLYTEYSVVPRAIFSHLITVGRPGRASAVFPASKCRQSQHKCVTDCTISSLCRCDWGSASADSASYVHCQRKSMQACTVSTRQSADNLHRHKREGSQGVVHRPQHVLDVFCARSLLPSRLYLCNTEGHFEGQELTLKA